MKKGVQKIYTEVAETYELVNHVLTLGLDSCWRKKAARAAIRMKSGLVLDVCSGTGEMAQYLSKYKKKGKQKIISLDFSHPMLGKAKEKRYCTAVFFVLADVGSLPFGDQTFDLVTLSFAMRNLNSIKERLISHLKEIHRILRPGGCFINLETSQPTTKVLRKLFHLYVKMAVERVGYLLSSSKAGYRYLSYTIPRFYEAGEFSALLEESGFSPVSCQRLLLGAAAIHTAFKPQAL